MACVPQTWAVQRGIPLPQISIALETLAINIVLVLVRSKYIRPRLKVHGVWCFNICLNISVLDETSKHDSNCVITVIAKALEEALPRCGSCA